MAPWLATFLDGCLAEGLDLAQPFNLAHFHAQSAREHHLETFGREAPLAVVLGNTHALWPAFVEALRRSPERLAHPHPLDEYVEEVITKAVRTSVPCAHRVYWGHHRAERVIPLQRIADAAGLAELGPAHLSVHSSYGPWIGLRAVLVFDEAADAAARVHGPSHCASCSQPCVVALERALAVSQQMDPPSAPLSAPRLTSRQRAWLAVRDACPVGRDARYGSLQLHYHYTKDPLTLRRAIDLPGSK